MTLQVTTYIYFYGNISSALRISSQSCQESLMFRFFLFSMTHSNSWRQFSMGHCHFCMSSKCGTNYPLFWMLFKDVYTYKVFENRDSISFWGKEQPYLQVTTKYLGSLNSGFLSYNVTYCVCRCIIWSFHITSRDWTFWESTKNYWYYCLLLLPWVVKCSLPLT